MLVEFRVTNFRSLRDEQVFSLVASKDKSLQQTNTMATGIHAVPVMLHTAAIYGANASGKSNLIKALQYMKSVVLDSASKLKPDEPFNVKSFQLDPASAGQPTQFDLTFLIDGIRYQYGFALTPQRITHEYLLVYKAAKPQRWFERHYDAQSGRDVYEFGASLKGAKNVWEAATRSNALFLSMAVQLNSDALRPVFDWFSHHLVIVNELSPLSPDFSLKKLRIPEDKQAICHFLKAADISIDNIDLVTRKVPGHTVLIDRSNNKVESFSEEVEENQLQFLHVTGHGQATFDLVEESSGTRNLLFIAGPVLDILQKGLTLIVDELDTSLHTLLVRRLVQLFQQPEWNRHHAQLVFTTHDTSLLDAADLLRRDQIWFVEKDQDQASSLYGLSDFSPRKHEALERGYLAGRYGGVPFLEQLAGAPH